MFAWFYVLKNFFYCVQAYTGCVSERMMLYSNIGYTCYPQLLLYLWMENEHLPWSVEIIFHFTGTMLLFLTGQQRLPDMAKLVRRLCTKKRVSMLQVSARLGISISTDKPAILARTSARPPPTRYAFPAPTFTQNAGMPYCLLSKGLALLCLAFDHYHCWRFETRDDTRALHVSVQLGYLTHSVTVWPCAGCGVERIQPLHFLAGCRKRRLNQALSVLSLKHRLFMFFAVY